MGWLKSLGRKAKNIGRKAKRITKKYGKKAYRVAKKTKIARKAMRSIPVLGSAYAAYDITKDLTGMVRGKKKKSSSRSLAPPALASFGGMTMGTGGTGVIPKGPGGKMQLPWSDPNTPAILQQFALDDQYLKPYYRAPKGYVVVRDASGRPYPMLKWAARKFGMWKPNKKPPISVGEHQAIKRADRAVKKIRKAMTTVSRVDKSVSKGGKVKCKKR